MSRLSDVQIDGQGRRNERGTDMGRVGRNIRRGLKKRGDALSAFLLAAKLRIDVSRSIQRLAASNRTEPRCAARLTPFVKKKKKEKIVHRYVSKNSNRIAESICIAIFSAEADSWVFGEARATRDISRGIRFLAV